MRFAIITFITVMFCCQFSYAEIKSIGKEKLPVDVCHFFAQYNGTNSYFLSLLNNGDYYIFVREHLFVDFHDEGKWQIDDDGFLLLISNKRKNHFEVNAYYGQLNIHSYRFEDEKKLKNLELKISDFLKVNKQNKFMANEITSLAGYKDKSGKIRKVINFYGNEEIPIWRGYLEKLLKQIQTRGYGEKSRHFLYNVFTINGKLYLRRRKDSYFYSNLNSQGLPISRKTLKTIDRQTFLKQSSITESYKFRTEMNSTRKSDKKKEHQIIKKLCE